MNETLKHFLARLTNLKASLVANQNMATTPWPTIGQFFLLCSRDHLNINFKNNYHAKNGVFFAYFKQSNDDKAIFGRFFFFFFASDIERSNVNMGTV